MRHKHKYVFLFLTFSHSGTVKLISLNIMFLYVMPAQILEGIRRKLKKSTHTHTQNKNKEIKESVKGFFFRFFALYFLIFVALLQYQQYSYMFTLSSTLMVNSKMMYGSDYNSTHLYMHMHVNTSMDHLTYKISCMQMRH